MGFDLNVSVPALTVFIQGLLSFFSPCVLPLLPMYLGYLSGGVTEDEKGELVYDRKKVLVNTVFFVVGVSFAFFILALGFTALGSFFNSKKMLFSRIGGVILIVLGLYQLGVFGSSRLLGSEKRLPLKAEKLTGSPLAALVLGFVFSFAWTPCVGPVLSGVLIMAASASTKAAGFLLIGVYTLGFVIPFLAAGLFTTSVLRLFTKHKNVVKYTVKAGGIVLILMGVMMLTGFMNRLTGYLSKPTAAQDDTPTEQNVTTTTAPAPATTTTTAGRDDSQKVRAFDFELHDQYGNVYALSDFRGKTVFLNFWATWCPPCRSEMPDIQKLYEKYSALPDENVVIIGVASPGVGSEQDEQGVKAFLEQNGYTYPVLMDDTGSVFGAYYVSAIPMTFMIDEDGCVYGYVSGAMSYEIMESIIYQTKTGSK